MHQFEWVLLPSISGAALLISRLWKWSLESIGSLLSHGSTKLLIRKSPADLGTLCWWFISAVFSVFQNVYSHLRLNCCHPFLQLFSKTNLDTNLRFTYLDVYLDIDFLFCFIGSFSCLNSVQPHDTHHAMCLLALLSLWLPLLSSRCLF